MSFDPVRFQDSLKALMKQQLDAQMSQQSRVSGLWGQAQQARDAAARPLTKAQRKKVRRKLEAILRECEA